MRRVLMTSTAVFALLALSILPSSAQEAAPRSAKVTFSSLNDSGLAGSASLARRGERTVVKIWADGAIGDHPTHIHQGSCDDLDPNPEFPLTNVQLATAGLTGTSETLVDVPLAELLDEDHLILIHRSAADIGTYLACGDIVAGRLSAAEQGSGGTGNSLPGTGVGPAAIAPLTVPGGLVVGALLALAVAIFLIPSDRRRLLARVSGR
jgi:hypothetical protein